MFNTRKECVEYLVKMGCVEALAKVAINECFNQVPQPAEEDNDLCRICTGPESFEVVVVPEQTAYDAYNEILDEMEIKHDGIYILGELKYDLNGGAIVHPEMDTSLQNSPTTETVQ